jgi:hypothetical protein
MAGDPGLVAAAPGATGVVGGARLEGAVGPAGAIEGLCAAAPVIVAESANRLAENNTPAPMTHFKVPRAIEIPPPKSAVPLYR